jgi:predicted dehydrogenase
LQFYGRLNAEARGDAKWTAYDRYSGAASDGDQFALPLNSDRYLKALYLDAEADSGYIRDRNVFGDGITSEDTLSLTARYRNGVFLNYSLICYCPWEGCRAAITGTKGRIEVFQQLGSQIITGDSNSVASIEERYEIKVFPMFGAPYCVPVVMGMGTHGGSDAVLMEDLFSASHKPDPLGHAAGFEAGVASMLMGAAANVSLATGQAVCCEELFPGAATLQVCG